MIYLNTSRELDKAYLIQAHNLTIGFLNLTQLHQEIPESGFCDYCICRKDPHTIQLRGGISLGGQMPPDNLVFRKAAYYLTSAIDDLVQHLFHLFNKINRYRRVFDCIISNTTPESEPSSY